MQWRQLFLICTFSSSAEEVAVLPWLNIFLWGSSYTVFLTSAPAQAFKHASLQRHQGDASDCLFLPAACVFARECGMHFIISSSVSLFRRMCFWSRDSRD